MFRLLPTPRLRSLLTVALALAVLGSAALDRAGAQAPAQPPAQAPAQQPPAQPPATPPAEAPGQENSLRPDNLEPGDAFGEEVTLGEKPIVYFSGSGQWDNAFDTIMGGFKAVNGYLQKQGIKPAGPPMTIYTSTNDKSFQFQAAIPVADTPKEAPTGDIAIGRSTAGKAFKFIHRGSYEDMDNTYDAIKNFLDEKQIDAKDLFIEQYVVDPLTTPPDKLVVEVYVLAK